MWFACSLLEEHSESSFINLVRPEIHTPYDFGGLSEAELVPLFHHKKELIHVKKLAELWRLYQHQKTDEMLKVGKHLESDLPFLLPAIQAHTDRIPSNGNLSKPVQALKEIREEFNTNHFNEIFKEFSKRESIYGFGDLQVKRLLDEICP